jgi:hypothetical protein
VSDYDVIVAATQIGLELDLLETDTSSALVFAGLA